MYRFFRRLFLWYLTGSISECAKLFCYCFFLNNFTDSTEPGLNKCLYFGIFPCIHFRELGGTPTYRYLFPLGSDTFSIFTKDVLVRYICLSDVFVLVITCVRKKFGINLPSSLFWKKKKKKKISRVKRERFQNFKNERGQFSPNFTNKHVIPGKSHVTTSQRAHKRKNYAKNNQSISANLINLTP